MGRMAAPDRTPDEQQLIEDLNVLRAREGAPPMTEQQENVSIAQAYMIGHLSRDDPPAKA